MKNPAANAWLLTSYGGLIKAIRAEGDGGPVLTSPPSRSEWAIVKGLSAIGFTNLGFGVPVGGCFECREQILEGTVGPRAKILTRRMVSSVARSSVGW